MKPYHINTLTKAGLTIGLVALLSANAQAETVTIGQFSQGQLANWEKKTFVGQTQYQLKKEGNTTVLKASSKATASGMGRRIRIDLHKTPFINWSWKIDNTLKPLNERSKAGDDYAARLYVVQSGGILLWKTKALNYVWSSNQGRGAIWDNAFKPRNAKMLAVRGTQDQPTRWVREKRNVRADFKQLFGYDLRFIDAVAIMTDTDNSKMQAGASYGDIFFTSQ